MRLMLVLVCACGAPFVYEPATDAGAGARDARGDAPHIIDDPAVDTSEDPTGSVPSCAPHCSWAPGYQRQ